LLEFRSFLCDCPLLSYQVDLVIAVLLRTIHQNRIADASQE
jgi:hypothetical protein